MRKYRLLVALLLFLAGTAFLYFQYKGDTSVPLPKAKTEKQEATDQKNPVPITQTSLFVPSWSLSKEDLPKDYNRFIYFGISAGSNGILNEDEGYQSIPNFLEQVPQGAKKLLAVKMTNSSTNIAILQNKNSQESVIDESIHTATENKFDGIVLDLEVFSLFDNVTPQINNFVQKFHDKAKQNNLTLALTIYGDLFYRKRPYDLSFLNDNSDEIMIMAYDLHKSIGEPGPNFPLSGKEKYGYDIETMLDEFTQKVPPKKLTVLFGMYGYDWVVDEKKRPLRQAKSLSLNEIRTKYLDTCGKTNCVPFRDDKAKENEMDYVDSSSIYHIIWFEDEGSVHDKLETIQEAGVGSIGYWAYGYF